MGGDQDQIYIPLAYQSVTTFTVVGTDVDIRVGTGAGAYHVYLTDAASSIANVQANTLFL